MFKEMQVGDNASWKQRFRAPRVFSTQLAHTAPDRGMAVSNKSGVIQLYAWDVLTGELTQITDYPEGKGGGTLSPDGRYIYYMDDAQGNEIGHYVRVPFEGGEAEDLTPDMPLYSSFSFDLSAGNRLGFMTAGQEGFTVYVADMDVDSRLGARKTIFHSDKLSFGPFFSYDGQIAVVVTTERTGMQNYELRAFDAASGELIASLWDGEENSVEPGSFCPIAGDWRILATSNQTGVKRPLIWNSHTGERIDLPLDGIEGEVLPWGWSFDGERVLLCQFSQAVQRFYVYNVAAQTLTRLDHPDGMFGGAYFVPNGEIWAMWQDATHPSQLIALDGKTGQMKRTLLTAGEVPFSHPWRSVNFNSSDGQEIQGWLCVPDGEGPFPTILHTHGGPESVMRQSFSSDSQMWVDHGFAFLTINYRGSTTFGKAFQEQIWGDLGHWEVEDLVGARDWLVEQGIAESDQILLTGWSYGGYLTLHGLGKRPDLWAGGMAGVAIADWAIQYEDSAPTLRGYQAAIFGGTPKEKPEQYAVSSPITYVDHVRAPVLIVQGRNDTRTPARPIEMYEAKMKELGKDIEVEWYDAGHAGSFAQVELSIVHHERMLRFAYRVLG